MNWKNGKRNKLYNSKNHKDMDFKRAFEQAKKDGHKGVRAITSDDADHHKIMKLLSEGKLETYTQRYSPLEGSEYFSECILLRKPKK